MQTSDGWLVELLCKSLLEITLYCYKHYRDASGGILVCICVIFSLGFYMLLLVMSACLYKVLYEMYFSELLCAWKHASLPASLLMSLCEIWPKKICCKVYTLTELCNEQWQS